MLNIFAIMRARTLLLILMMTLGCSTLVFADNNTAIKRQLIGTWKLVSMTREMIDTGVKTDDYGPNPIGYIHYSPEGRMMVMIVRSDRVKPKVKPDDQRPSDSEAITLYRSMSSYGGTYTIEDNKIIHHVDISWNQLWTGTKQVRYFKIKGDQITLTMAPFMTPSGKETVHLTWKKLVS